jgi:hypothetical protein
MKLYIEFTSDAVVVYEEKYREAKLMLKKFEAYDEIYPLPVVIQFVKMWDEKESYSVRRIVTVSSTSVEYILREVTA